MHRGVLSLGYLDQFSPSSLYYILQFLILLLKNHPWGQGLCFQVYIFCFHLWVLFIEFQFNSCSTLSKYGVHGFPTLFILNSTMRVRYQGSRTLGSLVGFYSDVTGKFHFLLLILTLRFMFYYLFFPIMVWIKFNSNFYFRFSLETFSSWWNLNFITAFNPFIKLCKNVNTNTICLFP